MDPCQDEEDGQDGWKPPVMGEKWAQDIGCHSQKNPSHEFSYPEHPVPGHRQPLDRPGKNPQKGQGNTHPQAQNEEVDEPDKGIPGLAHIGEQPQDKWSNTGGGYNTKCQTHKKGPKKSAIALGCSRGEPVRESQFPEAEKAGGKGNHDTGNKDQNPGVLKCGTQQSSGQCRRQT